ncbi:MAG: hypothetical protein JOZ14_04630 [Acidobacteria bacterium]|nr:hypothetical protein [Acidobacteriota bacterium]
MLLAAVTATLGQPQRVVDVRPHEERVAGMRHQVTLWVMPAHGILDNVTQYVSRYQYA